MQTSKVVKLNNLQKRIVDTLVELFESRMNDSYNQAKEKQASLGDNGTFRIFYLEYPFLVRMLQTLMRKYPLVIPYLLDRRIRVPEFAIFKKASVISFLDFLVVAGTVSEFASNSLLEVIMTTNYAYLQNKTTATSDQDN